MAAKLLIKDGENYAVIDTRNVKSNVVIDKSYSSGLWKNATPEMEAYLNKNGIKSTDSKFNKKICYEEGIFEEGEIISVIGKGKWKNSLQTKLDIPNEKVLIISSNGKEPVLISDHKDTLRY